MTIELHNTEVSDSVPIQFSRITEILAEMFRSGDRMILDLLLNENRSEERGARTRPSLAELRNFGVAFLDATGNVQGSLIAVFSPDIDEYGR